MEISIIKPAGNTTVLVNKIPSKKEQVKINNFLLQKFPSVEQVGFYQRLNENNAKLEMAGGEFCGNALRSLAYLLLEGKIGEMSIKYSGITNLLSAGIKSKNTAFAEMPILQSLESVQQLSEDLWKIQISGITHLITSDLPNSNEQLKNNAKKLLLEMNLLQTSPAAGVMFLSKYENMFSIRPVVWVRDIKTLFYETACASGTTAVGLWYSKKFNKLNTLLKVKQPSNELLSININRTNNVFIKAEIDGPIQIIKKIYGYK